MLRRLRLVVVSLAVAVPLVIAAPAHGRAIGPSAGACDVSGTMSVQPELGAVPQANVITNITVIGGCATLQLAATGSFDVGGQPVASCEVGEGTLAGGVSASDGVGTVPVLASYFGGPFTVHLYINHINDSVGGDLLATADLVWGTTSMPVNSVKADAACLTAGSGNSIPVTGVLTFDY